MLVVLDSEVQENLLPRQLRWQQKQQQRPVSYTHLVGVIKDWDSKWYADAEFSDYLVEDYNIRKFLKKKLYLSLIHI